MPNLNAGVNLGGWLSQCYREDDEYFSTYVKHGDIARIAAWGMDHVRLPVDYHIFESDARPFEYDPARLSYIDRCLEWCEARGLSVVLDLHGAPGFSFDELDKACLWTDTVMQDRFIAIWKMFARRYRGEGDWLVFELLNEIVLAAGSAPWNALAQRAIERIRSVDPNRVIVVGGNYYNSAAELANLKRFDDPKVIYTFHFYGPLVFTHQFASWVRVLKEFDRVVSYPGSSEELKEFLARRTDDHAFLDKYVDVELNKEWLRGALQPAFEFKDKTGLPLYCGEYGVIDRAPKPDAQRWFVDCIALLREYGIGRACWNYKERDFGLVNWKGDVVDEAVVKLVSAC